MRLLTDFVFNCISAFNQPRHTLHHLSVPNPAQADAALERKLYFPISPDELHPNIAAQQMLQAANQPASSIFSGARSFGA